MTATASSSTRPPYFALRFMAYVLRMGVALDCRCEGAMLLLAVVVTEDKIRYRKSVKFWNDHLCAYLGCRVDRLIAARKTLVDAGWLQYERGRKGVPGTYRVLVPGGDDQLNDAVLGDNDERFDCAKAQYNPESNSQYKAQSFIPIPSPEPNPSKPIGDGSRVSKKFSLWKNAKREEFSDPKNVQQVFDRAVKTKVCTVDERLHDFRLVALLIATTGAKDNFPGLLTSVLRGDAGHDPWRARGIDHEDTARAWMRSLDSPPEMQRRTSNLSDDNPDTTPTPTCHLAGEAGPDAAQVERLILTRERLGRRDADTPRNKPRSQPRDATIDFLTPLTGGSGTGTEKLTRCRPVSSQKGFSNGLTRKRQSTRHVANPVRGWRWITQDAPTRQV